jgi:hypothetical protein
VKELVFTFLLSSIFIFKDGAFGVTTTSFDEGD